MADNSGIEWTDATWNPIAGCSIVSPGCTNCYAMKMAARIEKMGSASHYAGLTQPSKAGPVWTGKVVAAPDHILTQPLRWKRPRRIFVNSMADLFHADVPDAWIDRVFAVMALCPQHTFQVLTKRAERMKAYVITAKERVASEAWLMARFSDPDAYCTARADKGFDRAAPFRFPDSAPWPLPNVWLGVSAEDQTRADERIPHLLATPVAKRFISAEPLLGPLNLRHLSIGSGITLDPMTGYHSCSMTGVLEEVPKGVLAQMPILPVPTGRLDWVITGGESGPNSRPPNPQWFRDLRDQCAAAGVAYFFKQWGEWVSVSEVEGSGPHFTFPDNRTVRRVGKKIAGAQLDGREHREFPA